MEFTFAVIFIAIAIVITIVDLYFAARSYREHTESGKQLARAESAVRASLRSTAATVERAPGGTGEDAPDGTKKGPAGAPAGVLAAESGAAS